jgi:hypothetical protein
LAVGLCLSVHCIESFGIKDGVYADGPRIPEMISKETDAVRITANSPVWELLGALPCVIDEHIEHTEPRVRSLVAKTVGAYAAIVTNLAACGGEGDMKGKVDELQNKRREVHDAILKSLKFHFERKVREVETAKEGATASDGGSNEKLSKNNPNFSVRDLGSSKVCNIAP